MGQDSWNLMFGNSHKAKYRKGTQVDMHSDEGYEGSHVIPGYAGAYKNEKTRVYKKPRAKNGKKGYLAKQEELIPIGKEFPMRVKKRR